MSSCASSCTASCPRSSPGAGCARGLRRSPRARRCRWRSTVSVDRLPAAVEATAYFVVAEALTNVAKHSRAGRAEVAARVEGGTLLVQVRDDGVGGARRTGAGSSGSVTGSPPSTAGFGWRARPARARSSPRHPAPRVGQARGRTALSGAASCAAAGRWSQRTFPCSTSAHPGLRSRRLKRSEYRSTGFGNAAIACVTLPFVRSAIGASTLAGKLGPQAAATHASTAICPMTYGYWETSALIDPVRT